VCLIKFGDSIEKDLGPRKFVHLYISALFASDYMAQKLDNKGRGADCLGASGALSALQSYACLSNPGMKIQVFGRFKLRAPWACLIWFLSELRMVGEETGISHGAHVGGFLFGVLFFLVNDVCDYGRGVEKWKLPYSVRIKVQRRY
jgi:membrane associated rhomboid family serine protease